MQQQTRLLPKRKVGQAMIVDDESIRELAYEMSRLREQVRILGDCCEHTVRWLEKSKKGCWTVKAWYVGLAYGYLWTGLASADEAGYERQRKESEGE